MHESAKPDDIPHEVWDKSPMLWGYEARIGIARAILADRARSPQDAKPANARGDGISGSIEKAWDTRSLHPPLAVEALRATKDQLVIDLTGWFNNLPDGGLHKGHYDRMVALVTQALDHPWPLDKSLGDSDGR